ncbi:hypothetical protein OH76DRAFT_43656 [Lentinus brumalis]|uniref:Putative gamma-glutamylcyclotransferase n=1 Tax=Lentinus brumalis TaxID=2498619 RepID=A0A371DY30_9APHY|nr:hypothetical protein OH76DRAFT_43656 [Polyporus brumalis]
MAVTGDSRQIAAVEKLVQPAHLRGYARFALHHKDYPAVIKHAETSVVDGLLFRPQTLSQRTKLDDFEGEVYKPTPVLVETTDAEGKSQLVDADMYLWDGDGDELSTDGWELSVFIQERLDDWLDLFGGMELVGDAIET